MIGQYVHDQYSDIDLNVFGGKAAALAHLAEAGLPIPKWIVIDPRACLDSLGVDPAIITDAGVLRRNLHLSDEFSRQLQQALERLATAGDRLAVRSSAVDEDGAGHSFAGQLESYLYVPVEQVAERIVDVWCSGFSERVVTYRQENGLSLPPPIPAVLIQRMVSSDCAGVAFAADPVSGRRDRVVVSAVYGLGSALVSGEVDADTWRIDTSNNIIERDICAKQNGEYLDEGTADQVSLQTIDADRVNAPVLTDQQLIAVVELARRCSRYFDKPQDIEWAMAGEQLFLLQSRPITALHQRPDPAGEHNLWDNSNIAESYGGITTPLTFSFARQAYESVYREFCRILRVPESVIAANDVVFQRMLGLIRGRVYYNLLSWYRVLALLPGFTLNRRFMEQMMGVKEGLPEEVAATLKGTVSERLRDAFRLGGSLLGLVWSHVRLPTSIRRFYGRLDDALNTDEDLTLLNSSQLAASYHRLEQKLLTRWDAPLINDFFAMIFYGVLRGLCTKWCEDHDETLQNNLLAGEGGMISAEPAKRVRHMAELAAPDEAFCQQLVQADVVTLMKVLAEHPQFQRAYHEYIEKFGDRCLDELKLESATLHDDPLVLLRSVGHFAERLRDQPEATEAGAIEAQIRASAEQRVDAALATHPIRRRIFQWVLRNTRHRVRDRENLRFERTRLFGRVRRIFVELGRRLYAEDLLEHHRDVFYLEVAEILGFIEGTAVTTDLKALVRLRKAEFAGYADMPVPADRFETFGIVHQGNDFMAPATANEVIDGDLKGIGCCPGVVRGRVRVIVDPRNAVLQAGEILVAERTDPGWIMLFPAAAGILVERGSLLSHSAIVSREMGIPAVVSVTAITRTLKDGDWVEFDGSTGVIRRLSPPEQAQEVTHEQ
ncbi:PEP/pyruvate-binding domain-containing protein [Gynuella sp.]|uniref:PEP/pyruvate-binding domain-containing protein n=1 Tax=Gynuella sp. TaxID=2969146 RepID=UPI003D0C6E5F